ncbi:hypothetical protein DH2020_010005 [Rehmannia glutinosa]|uniref:Cytochrome P450 protein n=1 Tax=Rehmannia glutinosa TaxID=99300 RepID=A0ABR0X9U1_REHGL
MSLRLGGHLLIVASSPVAAKEIFKTNNRIFSGRFLPSAYHNVPGVTHASLVMARECNDTWKFLRGLGHSYIFSSKAIESGAGIRAKKVTEMVGFLRANSKDGNVVNIEDLVYATFTNIISNVLISRDLFGEGESNYEKVIGFLKMVIEKVISVNLSDVFPVFKRVDFWSQGRAMGIYREIQMIWDDIIKERRGGDDESSTQDFFDVLSGHGFPDDQISILLTELLIASTESTIITVVWLMAELIKNQEILHKVREEISDKAVEENDHVLINESLLSECQYFQACIKETLRLHIPGPFSLPRQATETCKVNNFTIPKDSIVLVNVWAIQTDPNNWEDATSFKPERFINSKIDFKGAHFDFIPFGAGQRMCPGSNVAIKGVQLVVASLVHYFDWSLPNGEDYSKLDLSDRFGTTLKKDKPLCLVPRIREKYVAG